MNKNLSEKNEYIESFQKVCAYLFLVNKEVQVNKATFTNQIKT